MLLKHKILLVKYYVFIKNAVSYLKIPKWQKYDRI